VLEPAVGETPSDNLHLIGGFFYGYLTLRSLPASKIQQVGLGLDEQADEKRIPQMLKDAEFSNVSRAAET
jgi:hypothetical protein